MTISLMFLSMAILILWFIIGSKGHWGIKTTVIALTLYLCVSIGAALPDFAGWPSTAPLPSKFLVHWLVVKEPPKKTKKEGAIYVWATSLSDNDGEKKKGWRRFLMPFSPIDTSEPRVYKTPYSIDSHKEADGVVNRIKDGKVVIGERGKGKGDGKGGEGKGKNGSGTEGRDGNGEGSFSLSEDVNFQNLPSPSLPDKN